MNSDFGERRRPSRLVIALLAASSLLLVAAVTLIIVLMTDDGDASTPVPTPTPSATATPSASAAPSATPTATASAEPTLPPSPIRSFESSTTEVNCTAAGSIPLTFTWDTAGTTVSFGIGTEAADAEPYETGLPAVGTITVDYQCGQPAGWQQYSIAVFLGSEIVARDTILVSE